MAKMFCTTKQVCKSGVHTCLFSVGKNRTVISPFICAYIAEILGRKKIGINAYLQKSLYSCCMYQILCNFHNKTLCSMTTALACSSCLFLCIAEHQVLCKGSLVLCCRDVDSSNPTLHFLDCDNLFIGLQSLPLAGSKNNKD